jgi:hypothetical protein
VVTNNHFQGKAVVNALQILSGLSGDAVETPPTLLDHYPELYATTRNLPPQRSLFFEQSRRDRPLRAIPPRRVGIAAAYARA